MCDVKRAYVCASAYCDSDRLRAFPALVTCCYIDWFHAWPSDALHAVAEVVLGEECSLEAPLQAAVTKLCVFIHEQADQLAKAAAQEQGRTYQVTPSLFLRFVSTFAGMVMQVSSLLHPLLFHWRIVVTCFSELVCF